LKKIKGNVFKGINPITQSSITPSNLQILNQLPQLQPKKRTYEQHLEGLTEKNNITSN
jgi:hypothetical protein